MQESYVEAVKEIMVGGEKEESSHANFVTLKISGLCPQKKGTMDLTGCWLVLVSQFFGKCLDCNLTAGFI